jgi:hypothetical protein
MGYDNAALFTTGTPNATLTAWWDDLKDDGISHISYKTEGTAPYRVFTAEWKRMPTYYSDATSRISFQVRLYESTNVIEFHYGDLEPGIHHASEGASIGIEDATGGPGRFKEATTGSTTIGVSTLKSEINWPSVNYRYTPEVLKQTFNNLTVSNTGGPVIIGTDTDVNGILNVTPGAELKVSSGQALEIKDLGGN